MKTKLFFAAIILTAFSFTLSSCAGTNGLVKAKPKSGCNCPHF